MMRLTPVGERPPGRSIALVLTLLILAPRAWAQPTLADPNLSVELVVSGLALPTTMAFVGPDDILVLQKNNGRVRRVVGGVLLSEPVLDVPVNFQSERGLLGIAVNTESPPRVFLYYTEGADPGGTGADGGTPLGNRVYRYTWNAGAGRLEDPELILDLPVTPGPNHDGGVLLLGPPGTLTGPAEEVGDGAPLYAVIGDLNRNGKLQNFPGGPDPDDTGVILRVRQDGAPFPGNPFTPFCGGSPSTICSTDTDCLLGTCQIQVRRYFAYGVRNSFGLALDPVTGHLWDTENGPADFDEVNLVLSGFNSGWEQIMGPDSRDPQGVDDLFHMPLLGSTYSDPEFSWLETVAPTAILFPVGSLLGPAHDAVALVGDVNLGNLYRFPLRPDREEFELGSFPGLLDLVADSPEERDQVVLGRGFGGITDLKLGPDGAVYVVSIGQGVIYRITGPGAPAPGPGNPGTLQFETGLFTADEGGGPAVIGVTRQGGTDGTVSVQYRTEGGTATPGLDYGAVSGEVVFGDGEGGTKTFTAPIFDDGEVEGNETAGLVLSDPAGGATLGSPATAILTILDDDGPAAEDESLPLAAEEVACDAGRLSGLLQRTAVLSPGTNKPRGFNLTFTRSGDFMGLAYTGNGPETPEHHLMVSTNPEETTLLRNPARLQLFTLSLTRNNLNSDLVAPGDPDRLEVVVNTTLDPAPDPAVLLVVDNLDEPQGQSTSAKPGRGLQGLLDTCHRKLSRRDAHLFQLLAKIVRAEAADTQGAEIAILRGPEVDSYRIIAFLLRDPETVLGWLTVELRVTYTSAGFLESGTLRLLDPCLPGEEVASCSGFEGAGTLQLVSPVFRGEFWEPSPYRVSTSEGGTPDLRETLVDWQDLLEGTTWRKGLE